MTKAEKKYYESIELTQAYAETHPELKELIDSIIRASKHPKTMCKITIGKYHAKNESFEVRLVSNVRFLNVLFSSIGNEPIIILRNNSKEHIVMFNLTGIENICYKGKRSFGKPLDCEIQKFMFHYCGVDYELVLTYDMKHVE